VAGEVVEFAAAAAGAGDRAREDDVVRAGPDMPKQSL